MPKTVNMVKVPRCRRCEDFETACPDHGGDWRGMSARCAVCRKEMRSTPSGKVPAHKPAGRNSWLSGYTSSVNRPMVDRFEFNKCPGGNKPHAWRPDSNLGGS